MVSIYRNWLISIVDQETLATAMSPCQTILIEINKSSSLEATLEDLKSRIEIIEACPIPFSLLSRYIDKGFQALKF